MRDSHPTSLLSKWDQHLRTTYDSVVSLADFIIISSSTPVKGKRKNLKDNIPPPPNGRRGDGKEVPLPYCQSAGRAKDFVVVIDAGHGGHDPGAIGRISKEKNINRMSHSNSASRYKRTART